MNLIFKGRRRGKGLIKDEQDQAVIMQQAISFINEIKSGNVDVRLGGALASTKLGESLKGIGSHLQQLAREENQRKWVSDGLTKFADLLRNKESLQLQQLTDQVLSELVKYIGANQGVLFLTQGEGNESFLEMISCYAYDKKKFVSAKIAIGEGLIGQCVLEKEVTFLKEVPANHIKITSGLGGDLPRSILICPLLINDEVFGVVELASFTTFSSDTIAFVKKLSEYIASSIRTVRESERVVALLNASQQQAEELRSQEEEMRQNLEELTATQEEMQRKSDEISRTSAEMLSIMKGINTTMATIEFTPEGRILTANANFLKATRYTLSEISGEHHAKFVPEEIRASKDYKTFWSRLANGESFTGIFKRLTSAGEVIWLNAIYNPILDAKGEVVKIVKFATDVTKEQEMLAQNRGILNGINATMATVDFTPDGNVIYANDRFLKCLEYELEQVKGRHHRMFVPDDLKHSDEYIKFWERLARGESFSGTFRRVSSKGRTVWLNAIYNPILNAEGKVVKITKFAIDITEAQERLAEHAGIMAGVNTTMAIIEFNSDGQIINANDNFLALTNYRREEVVGQHHRIFVSNEEQTSGAYQSFWQELAAGKPKQGLFERRSRSGAVIWLNAIYSPIHSASGEVIKIVKFATDITDERIRQVLT